MIVNSQMVAAMGAEKRQLMPDPSPLPGQGISTTGVKIIGLPSDPSPDAKRRASRDQKVQRAETLKRHLERQEKYSRELSTLQEELHEEMDNDPFNEAQDLLALHTDEESFDEASESMLRESSDEEPPARSNQTPKRKLASEVHIPVPAKKRDLRKSPSKSK